MKRILYFAILLITVGCVQSSLDESSALSADELYAVIEGSCVDQTRTYVDNQARMRWHAEDYLTVFKKNTYGRKFMFTGKTGANAGGFRQVSVDDDFWFGYDVDANYAVYPYSEETVLDETSCTINLTMPAEQTYAENTFGRDANTMVAVSETSQLIFKNVGSYLRVRLYGENTEVSSITITTKGNEAISGEAVVTPVMDGYPTCNMIGSGKSITLTCPSPVAISSSADVPTDFWIVLPPVTLNSGFKVTVKDVDNNEQTYDVDKSFSFARNTYYNLKREVTINEMLTQPTEIPNNQIWYTSSDEKIINPYANDVFGANIISNTYENGKGVITFDDEVSEIGDFAFRDCAKLVSIMMPNSIKSIGRWAFGYCSKLADVEMSSNIISIGELSFGYCHNISKIILPESLSTIGGEAFRNCMKLKDVYFNTNITSIGDSCFAFCFDIYNSSNGHINFHINSFEEWCKIIIAMPNGLVSGLEVFYFYINGQKINDLIIPKTIETINPRLFSRCSLNSITIGNNIKQIGAYAFAGSKISQILLTDGLKDIGAYAFAHMNYLSNIEIPESVTNIGEYAFYYERDNPTNIYCRGTNPPTIGEYTFSDKTSERKIYVPSASYDAYVAQWADYANNIVKYDFTE